MVKAKIESQRSDEVPGDEYGSHQNRSTTTSRSEAAPTVAFVFTHRIQYFANLLDELHCSGQIRPVAIYAHRTEDFTDKGFGRVINWDNRAEARFPQILLPAAANKQPGRFFSSFDHALSGRLDELKPSCVHLNGFGNAIQWQAWWWARKNNVPILARGDGDTLGSRASLTIREKLRLRGARMFTRSVDHVFFQGEEN